MIIGFIGAQGLAGRGHGGDMDLGDWGHGGGLGSRGRGDRLGGEGMFNLCDLRSL